MSPPGQRSLFDERDGLAGDAFAPACEAQAIGGGGFDADLLDFQVEMLRQVGAHAHDVRSHARTLGDDGGVNVDDLPFVLT